MNLEDNEMEENNRIENLEEKAIRFAHLMKRVTHLHHRHEEGPMIHPGQGKLLLLILRKEPVGQKELVEMLDIRPSSLSELLKKLEAKGLVTRTPDEQDKRNMIVTLTGEGKALAEKALAGKEEQQAKIFEALCEEERVQLGALLDKLCGAWQKELDDAGEQEPPHRPHPGPHGPHGPGPEMHEFHRHHDGCCKMERFMREAKRCDMDRE